MGKRHFFYRGIYHFHPPTLGAIRLGVNTNHLETVLQDLRQTGGCDIRGSHKNNTHLLSSKGNYSSASSSSSVRKRSMTWVYRMPSK